MKEKQSHDFTQKLLTLVIPIAFQQFMLALVSASDALMLGMLTQDALSAVSLAGQITFVENLFLAAMAIGLSMLAAQYWGKGDRAAVERIFAYVMKITAVVSFLFFIAGFIIPGVLMRIFTNEQILIEGGRIYLRTVSPAFLLTGIAKTGKPGVVVVDLPKDVQRAYGSDFYPKEIAVRGYKPKRSVHMGQLNEALDLLNHAAKPVFLTGGG